MARYDRGFRGYGGGRRTPGYDTGMGGWAGPRPRRYDADRGRWGGPAGGYDAELGGWGGLRQRGYDAAYADTLFLPDEVYRRYPRFDRPPRHVSGRWPDEAEHAFGARRRLDDRYVEQAVRETLYGDTWLDPSRIQVAVEEGVVTLNGEVDDYMEARYAWDDAWESPGVRGVVNQLTVRAQGSPGRTGDPLPQTE